MPNKEERFFVLILFLALTGMAIIAGAIWYLQVVGITSGARIILTLLAAVFSIILIIFVLGFGSVVLTLVLNRPLPWLMVPTQFAVGYLFPITLYFGKFLGFSKADLQRAFVQVSNHLVQTKGIKVRGDEILILLPHCLQKFDCPYKVTSDVENCRRCGQCSIDRLLDLKAKYGCHLAVATGGTLARKVVKELKPKAIVAVACERDLTSGIQDTYPLPVTGVVNIRPEGPCVNTQVNVQDVEKAIFKFLRRD